MDMNCAGPFICGFSSMNTDDTSNPQVLHTQIQPTAGCKQYFLILKPISQLQIPHPESKILFSLSGWFNLLI